MAGCSQLEKLTNTKNIEEFWYYIIIQSLVIIKTIRSIYNNIMA